MICKNCSTKLHPKHNYCNQCGAKVVKERITLKQLFSNLLVALGWDSYFFVTFRDLIIKPQIVFEKYLNGTRKKYANPLSFFAIGVSLSVLVFNFYSDELIKISTNTSLKQYEIMSNSFSIDENEQNSNIETEKIKSIMKKYTEFSFNFYFYLSFLLLPLYAFIAFLTFGKPNNYAEHLVINAYIHGLLFYFSLLLFILTLILRTNIFSIGVILLFIAYNAYAYKKYRNYTFGKLLLRVIKFLVIFLLLFFIISFMAGFIYALYSFQ